MTDADVIIAGAGPAGVATAVALAARIGPGRVLVLDKARFPRDKPCGGGLTGHAHAALKALGLQVRVPRVPCGTGRIVYRSRRDDVPLERPVDIVRRRDFDADLVEQARERGVEIVAGEGLSAFQVDDAAGQVAIETTGGRRLTARVLVGADGAGSRVRKTVSVDDRPPLRLFQAEVDTPPALAGEVAGRMIYDFSLMARGLRGYLWLFPSPGGRLNVGAMHTINSGTPKGFRASRDELRRAKPGSVHAINSGTPKGFRASRDELRRAKPGSVHAINSGTPKGFRASRDELRRAKPGSVHASVHKSGAEIEALLREGLAPYGVTLPDGARGWPAWRFRSGARIAAPHLVCVGDAAGIDALTGEGIAVGLEHGPIAADAIAGALASGDFRFADYGPAVARAVVGRELALDARLAAMLYAPRAANLWLSLILFDRRVQRLYAARVSGSEVLADRGGALLGALVRHAVTAPSRMARLRAA